MHVVGFDDQIADRQDQPVVADDDAGALALLSPSVAELRASGTARTVTLTIASKNWSAAAASSVVAAFALRDGGESAAAAFAPMAIARINDTSARDGGQTSRKGPAATGFDMAISASGERGNRCRWPALAPI